MPDQLARADSRYKNSVFYAPTGASACFALARKIDRLIGQRDVLLLGWPIFEDELDNCGAIVQLLRTAFGYEASVADKPGLIVQSTEAGERLQFIYVYLLLQWDVYVVTLDPALYISVSHDGAMGVYCSSENEFAQAEMLFSPYQELED